jgi:hypothetical protein
MERSRQARWSADLRLRRRDAIVAWLVARVVPDPPFAYRVLHLGERPVDLRPNSRSRGHRKEASTGGDCHCCIGRAQHAACARCPPRRRVPCLARWRRPRTCPLPGPGGCLRARVKALFDAEVAHVAFDRALAKPEGHRDLLIRLPLGEQGRHVLLPPGEGGKVPLPRRGGHRTDMLRQTAAAGDRHHDGPPCQSERLACMVEAHIGPPGGLIRPATTLTLSVVAGWTIRPVHRRPQGITPSMDPVGHEQGRHRCVAAFPGTGLPQGEKIMVLWACSVICQPVP